MTLRISHHEAAKHLLTLPGVISLDHARSIVTHWLEAPKHDTPVANPDFTTDLMNSLQMKLRLEQKNVFNGAPYRLSDESVKIEFDCPFCPFDMFLFQFVRALLVTQCFEH